MAHRLGQVVSPKLWPRDVTRRGLGYSWLGAAWVALLLHRSGVSSLRLELAAHCSAYLDAEWRRGRCDSISLFVGSAGAVLVAALLADVDTEHRAVARACRERWSRDVEASTATDYVEGAAGALVACAELDSLGYEHLSCSALQSLHYKVDQALASMIGASEFVPGLAHGAAGYLLALELAEHRFGLRYSPELREQCFDALIGASFAPEADPSALYWPATSHAGSVDVHGWCHGSPGIGLALTIAHKVSGIEAYREASEMALRATARQRAGGQTFCCGIAGRAQVLLEAYRLSGDIGFLESAREVASELMPVKLEESGFLKGVLGIDYLHCRLRHPNELPLAGLASY